MTTDLPDGGAGHPPTAFVTADLPSDTVWGVDATLAAEHVWRAAVPRPAGAPPGTVRRPARRRSTAGPESDTPSASTARYRPGAAAPSAPEVRHRLCVRLGRRAALGRDRRGARWGRVSRLPARRRLRWVADVNRGGGVTARPTHSPPVYLRIPVLMISCRKIQRTLPVKGRPCSMAFFFAHFQCVSSRAASRKSWPWGVRHLGM